MDPSDAQQKFFSTPEMVERLISFLPPQSVLHMAEFDLVGKDTLQKSLGSEAWNKLIRRRGSDGENGELQEEDVNSLVKILKLMELKDPSKFIQPLLDHICKLSGLGGRSNRWLWDSQHWAELAGDPPDLKSKSSASSGPAWPGLLLPVQSTLKGKPHLPKEVLDSSKTRPSGQKCSET